MRVGKRKVYTCGHLERRILKGGKMKRDGSQTLLKKNCGEYSSYRNCWDHEKLPHPFCPADCSKCKTKRRRYVQQDIVENEVGREVESMEEERANNEVERSEEEGEVDGILCGHSSSNQFCRYARYKPTTIDRHEVRHFLRGECPGECGICERMRKERVVSNGKERKGKVLKYLHKLGEYLGLQEVDEIIAEILVSVKVEDSFDGILKGSEKKKILKHKLKGYFRLERGMRKECKRRRKQEREEMMAEIGPLYLDLRLTQGDVQKLMQTFHFGPTAAQYRWWKSKEAASFALSKSPGGRGYLWDLEDAVRSLYNEENMSALTVENGVHLPMFLSVDGGWLDHSNSAIFVKLVRSDSSWVEKGNRHKVPSLAATLAVLYMEEEPIKLAKELGHIYQKLNGLPVQFPNETHQRIVSLTHSNDAKMSCILFGSPNAYCTR